MSGTSLLWNPYIFCGMPGQASGLAPSRWFDVINTGYASFREIVGNIFGNDYVQHTVFLMFMAIASYFFMRQRKATLLVSVFAAVAITFSTGIVVFVFIGHITKLYTLSAFPLVLMLLFRFQEKIKFLDVVLFIIALAVMVSGWHVQMIFYSYFAFGLYFVYFFIRFLILKEFQQVKRLFASAGLLIAGSALAIIMVSDIYLQILEYTPYSTRGTKSISERVNGETQKTQSAFYDYATGWSFSPGEVLTFVVPSYYGFGNMIYKGSLSNDEEVEVNTYFGQMEFVDVAMYMGVIVFFLALFAMYACRKDPLVQFLSLLALVSLFISFGKTLPFLFDLMFYHFPFFDKFRVPSMMLTMVQVSLPFLAASGLMKIISLRENPDPKVSAVVKYSAIVFSVLLVIFLVANSSISSWFVERVNTSANGKQLGQIADFIADVFVGDLLIGFALLTAAFWFCHAYITGKLSGDVLAFLIILLTVFDLFRISQRGAKFIDKQDVSGLFNEPAYVKVIKAQKDKDVFRILNFKQDGSLGSISRNSNYNMYFQLHDLGGYSGIKPRSYQDYMDVVGPANPTLWRMLNIKYLVFDRPIQAPEFEQIYGAEKTFVYRNNAALPRVYFVNRVEKKEPIDILNNVKDAQFDPKDVAYVEKPMAVDRPDTTAETNIKEYSNEHVVVEAKATGNNFLFFGDTYTPVGWTATIDGNKTDILRADYGFRGVLVPKGTHTIVFDYAPRSYYLGKYGSLTVNILVLLGLGAGLFLKKRKKADNLA